MYYIIDRQGLYDSVKAELSRAADEAYSEDGQSLYDMVAVTERDRDMVYALIMDAARTLVRRMVDVAKFSPTVDTGGNAVPRIMFYLPDFDESLEEDTVAEIGRYITLSVSARIMQTRRAQLVPRYQEMAAESMERAVGYLKSRKYPVRVW